MPIAAEYPLLNIIWTMLVFFAAGHLLRLLFTVFADLFRRDDNRAGRRQADAVRDLLSFLGVLSTRNTRGGIAQRNAELERAQKARFDEYVRDASGSGGATARIAKAKELLDSGAISQAEFDQVKQKALA